MNAEIVIERSFPAKSMDVAARLAQICETGIPALRENVKLASQSEAFLKSVRSAYVFACCHHIDVHDAVGEIVELFVAGEVSPTQMASETWTLQFTKSVSNFVSAIRTAPPETGAQSRSSYQTASPALQSLESVPVRKKDKTPSKLSVLSAMNKAIGPFLVQRNKIPKAA